MDTTLPGDATGERFRNIHRLDRLRDPYVLRFSDNRVGSCGWPPENIYYGTKHRLRNISQLTSKTGTYKNRSATEATGIWSDLLATSHREW
jgi:hypothetical protein